MDGDAASESATIYEGSLEWIAKPAACLESSHLMFSLLPWTGANPSASRSLPGPGLLVTGEDGLSGVSSAVSDLRFPLFGLDDRRRSTEGRLAGSLAFADFGAMPQKGGATKYVRSCVVTVK